MAIYSQLVRTIDLARLGRKIYRSSHAKNQQVRREALRGVITGMASLHGLPQKIGQILSLGELDSEQKLFEKLTGSGSTEHSPEGLQWIKQELGTGPFGEFRNLSEEASLASIGQVHKGQLRDGTVVAVKVQYPRICESIEGDLSALGWLAMPISAKRAGFDLSNYQQVLRDSLLSELDYVREAAALARFAARVQDEPALNIPRPITELCCARVLTTTWVEGVDFSNVTEWSLSEKTQVAQQLLRFFLKSWLLWGEVHADPHPGNFRFSRDNGRVQVSVLDFGCVAEVSPMQSQAFSELIDPARRQSPSALLESYVRLGFKADLLEPMVDKLPEVTKLIFLPFLSRGPFSVEKWALSSRMEHILGEDRWNFRFAGPANLLHFVRTLSGLVSYMGALNVEINWALELDRIYALLPVRPRSTTSGFIIGEGRVEGKPEQSRRLKIRVSENGHTKVQLAFGVRALENLVELMPPEVLLKLREQDIDPDKIAQSRIREGFKEGELFCVVDGEKYVKVWIE